MAAEAAFAGTSVLPSVEPAAVPRRARLLYSLSSLGGEALSRSQGAWFIYYYSPPANSGLPELLPGLLLGVLLVALRVLGALDDIIIGWWSDRTSTRWGRRLPFILAGTPLSAITAILIVVPPANAGTATIALYLFVMMELNSIFGTLSGGPYEALLPDLARTSRERVGLVAMKLYFGVAGAAVGLIVASTLVDVIGVRQTLILMVLFSFACRMIGMFGIWNHADRTAPPARIPLRVALKATFSNSQFLAFLPSFVLFQTGVGLLVGLLPYYAEALLADQQRSFLAWTPEKGTWVAILTAAAFIAMMAVVPLFMKVARERSKREAYSQAMLAAGLSFPLLFFAGFIPGIPPVVQIVVVMAIVGAPLAGVFLFPAALTADLADNDANDTGMRREATYFGTQNFVEKTAGSLTPLVLLLLLQLGNTAGDPLGIRLVGPVAGILVLTGYWTFRKYQLPDEIATLQLVAAIDPGQTATPEPA
ncbi:MAG TPA: MFS transporter [Thermomicrobiales bacterium]|nr:MFS transporter [Thermomicrobiales bacterium]